MGNCCRAESYSSSSSMIWAGEDWSSLCKDGGASKRKNGGESKRRLGGANGKRVSSSSSRRREVKIIISKKELEKLVEKIEAQALSLEHVLPLLINQNYYDHCQSGFAKHDDHCSWRPALQSIPETI